MKLDLGEHGIMAYELALPLDPKIELEYSHWLPDTLNKASLSRRQEYLAGRVCAHKCAETLGMELLNLPSLPSRAPSWPENLVGSITHTKRLAIAALGFRSQFKSVGIDAEELIDPAKIAELSSVIASDTEMKVIWASPQNEWSQRFTILFSAKESLFKALNPLCHSFIDFKDAEMKEICLKSNSFILSLKRGGDELSSLKGDYEGKIIYHKASIVTVIILNT